MEGIKEMTLYGEKLKAALAHGPIRAIGGIVYDGNMDCLMSTTDLYDAIREIYKEYGIRISRTDSGGSPTWEIEL